MFGNESTHGFQTSWEVRNDGTCIREQAVIQLNRLRHGVLKYLTRFKVGRLHVILFLFRTACHQQDCTEKQYKISLFHTLFDNLLTVHDIYAFVKTVD